MCFRSSGRKYTFPHMSEREGANISPVELAIVLSVAFKKKIHSVLKLSFFGFKNNKGYHFCTCFQNGTRAFQSTSLLRNVKQPGRKVLYRDRP